MFFKKEVVFDLYARNYLARSLGVNYTCTRTPNIHEKYVGQWHTCITKLLELYM